MLLGHISVIYCIGDRLRDFSDMKFLEQVGNRKLSSYFLYLTFTVLESSGTDGWRSWAWTE